MKGSNGGEKDDDETLAMKWVLLKAFKIYKSWW